MEYNFEEAMAKLKEATERLSKDEINLEDSFKAYEEAKAYYDICMKQLEGAKGKMVQVTKEDMCND